MDREQFANYFQRNYQCYQTEENDSDTTASHCDGNLHNRCIFAAENV